MESRGTRVGRDLDTGTLQPLHEQVAMLWRYGFSFVVLLHSDYWLSAGVRIILNRNNFPHWYEYLIEIVNSDF